MKKNLFFSVLALFTCLLVLNVSALTEEESTLADNIQAKSTEEPSLEYTSQTMRVDDELITDLTPKIDVTSVDTEVLSRAYGHLIATNLEIPGFKFSLKSIISGMKEAQENKGSPLTEEEYRSTMAAIQEQAFNLVSNENLQKANTFMSENRNKEGIQEMEEGKLQYLVNQKGEGNVVTENSVPLVKYTGRYLDGTVFGNDAEEAIPLDQTLLGFKQGVVGMKEGECRTLYIHPDLGSNNLGSLSPNSLLVFDVEIIQANTTSERTSDKLLSGETTESELSTEELDLN